VIENKAPDTILFNGKVYTVDKQRTVASAVALCGDRILAVGSDAEILPMAGKETKVIDLCGKLVLPGLNDSHAHPFWMATQINFAAFTEARCIQDCLDILAKKAAETPEGEWIIVSMTWHETQLKEKRLPTRKEIDTVCPNHPVLIPRGGHVRVANSKLFELAGIEDGTPDPPGGMFGRDADGNLDGMMVDNASEKIDRLMPVMDKNDLACAMEKVGKLVNSFGVTTTAELGFLAPARPIHINNFTVLDELYAAGRMSLRIPAMIYVADYESAQWAVEFGKQYKTTDYFKFQGIKLTTDAGVEGASLIEPYMVIDGLQDNPDFHGIEFWNGERKNEFRKIMQLVADEGLMLQVHINGDRSARDILPMLFEQAEKTDVAKLNWTICHLPFATDEQIDQIKKCGYNVTIQHQPYLLGLNMRRWWGDDRANSQENYRKYIDKGLKLGGGTDYPIGPSNPFPCMQFMVDRKITDGSLMGPESAITIEEAVYLWTQGSANVEGFGDVLGSIEPGKMADLVVLNQDILTVPTEQIGKTTVASTWLGGKCVYQQ